MTAQQIIVLTGASGKLGKVLLSHFLTLGHRVVATTLRPESVDALRRDHSVACSEGRLLIWSGDLTNDGSVDALLSFIDKSKLKPTSLINNARSLNPLRNMKDGRVSRDAFSAEFLLDVTIPYELTVGVAGTSEGHLSRVVNVSSIYGIVAANRELYLHPENESPLHYSVAKAALIHLTRELAVRLAPRNICVNSVSFGGVEGRADAAFVARYSKLSPSGRMLREGEIVAPVEFLLSEGASGVTGHNLVVDGGWSVW